MLICKAIQHKLTMAFTGTNNNGFPEIVFEIFQIPEPTPAPKKIYFHVRNTRSCYNNKQPRQTKNYKRYRQTQPRNRGTNHTLMRKGNTW